MKNQHFDHQNRSKKTPSMMAKKHRLSLTSGDCKSKANERYGKWNWNSFSSMLLSLLSKRTLEADSRDAYGFTVRPHHLQRYREYTTIYKEEEEERSGKWSDFLEQEAESSPLCSSEEHGKILKVEEKAVSEKTLKRDDSGDDKSVSDDFEDPNSVVDYPNLCDRTKEVPVVKETKISKVRKRAHNKPTMAAIENMLSAHIKNSASMNVEQRIKSLKQLSVVEEEKQPEGVSLENSCSNKQLIASQNHLSPVQDAMQPGGICEEKLEGDLCSHEQLVTSQNYLSPIEEAMQSEENVEDKSRTNEQLIINQDRLSPSEEPMQLESKENLEETCCVEIMDNRKHSSSPESDDDDDDGLYVEPSFPWKKELESLVRGGVPKALRGEVWQAFVGVRTRRVEGYYQDMLSADANVRADKEHASPNGVPLKWKKQIEKDLPRTFPGHPALNEYGRDSLRRVLLAYARHNPSVGYCQAMNFFAGLFLLMMPEENAFWTLVGMIDDYFDGYFSEEMIESQVDQLVFEELMREKFPKLVNHLDYLGVQVAWISAPWFLSIFVNMLPWESVLRVWDVLLFEGNRVMIFRTALALMDLYGTGFLQGPTLVTTKDAGEAISLLQSLAGSTFDSSQLVLTACMGYLPINEERLQELRKKHRPSVLLIIEERSKGCEVSKDTKGLASKLMSFKRPPKAPVEDASAVQNFGSKHQDGDKSSLDSGSTDFDLFFDGLTNADDESDPDLQEQVDWMKVELCRLLEEKRSALLRAEELEIAFMEMVKQDNRRQLSAKVEQLEQEVAELRQLLSDKKEQESAMLQVLMRVEQEQRLTEEARRAAEHDAAAQRFAVHILEEKYEKAMASVALMEKRVVMAESLLEATLQYESGQVKALSSPRYYKIKYLSLMEEIASSSARQGSQETRKTGLLFGLGWRDRNKAEIKPAIEGLDPEHSPKRTSRPQ